MFIVVRFFRLFCRLIVVCGLSISFVRRVLLVVCLLFACCLVCVRCSLFRDECFLCVSLLLFVDRCLLCVDGCLLFV